MDNLLSGYPFTRYYIIQISIWIPILVRFLYINFTKVRVKSNLIINGGGVDSPKSRKYDLMAAGSSPAANVLAILVLMYGIFETSIKIMKSYMKKYRYTKRVSSHT